MKIKKSYLLITSILFSVTAFANDNRQNSQKKDSALIVVNENSLAKIKKANTGALLIAIEKVDDKNVSHNKYDRFDVSKKGVILDNRDVKATYIINEVINNGPMSALKGNINIEGKAAHVIIANPNGIMCKDCQFSNTLSETLVSGTVSRPDDAIAIYHPAEADFKIDKSISTPESNKGKVTFIKSARSSYDFDFNQLNIVSSRINVRNRIKSLNDINIFNNIVAGHYLDNSIKQHPILTHSNRTNKIPTNPAKKAVLKIVKNNKMNNRISNYTTSGIISAGKINLYALNSFIYNHGIIDGENFVFSQQNSKFNNYGLIYNVIAPSNENKSNIKNIFNGRIIYKLVIADVGVRNNETSSAFSNNQ